MNITKITQICLLASALTLSSKYVAQVNAIIQPSVTLIYGSDDTTRSFQEIQENAHAYFANYHALNGPAIPKEEKRYKRWEYFWQNKVCYPNQTVHGDLGAHNFYKNALQTNVINTCLAPTTPVWNQVGPTTMSQSQMGIINCVAVDPNSDITNPSTMHLFAGSYTSGLFKSIDGGASWTNITDYLRLPSMGITSIAIDKHNVTSLKMLFSTGDGYKRTMSSYDYGVYYSTDGGSTWTPSTFNGGPVGPWGNALDLGIDLVKYDESDASGLKVFAIGGQHIYVSFDGGVTFDSKLSATPFQNYGGFKELEIDLNDPNYVYATTNSSQYYNSANILTTEPAQLWISTNGGLNWTQQIITLPGGLPIGNKVTVDVTPAAPGSVFYAANSASGSTIFFYESTNHGTSWNLLSQTSNPVGFGGFGGHFEVSNTNFNTFYIGDVTGAKSVDGGSTFTGFSGSTYIHDDIRYIDFFVPNSGLPAVDWLLLGTDGGVMQSTDAAASWQNLNGTGLSITQFYGFDDHLTNTSLLAGGTQDNHTMDNSTGPWVAFSAGDGGWTQRDDVDPAVFYGNANQDIKRYGSPAANFGNPEGGWKLGMKILIDPCDHTKLWFGLTHLYFNVLGTWTPKWTNPNPSGSITAMAIAPSNCNIMYLAYSVPSGWGNSTGIASKKLFKSTDGGTTFTDISAVGNFNTPILGSYITDIVIDPLDPNHVYFSFAGYWASSTNVNAGQLRVMETHDGANTVFDISDDRGLPPFPVVSLEYQKGSTGTVFAGTDVGIYRYDYINQVWECFNHNMPSAPVTNMEINYCTNPMQMTASTFGRGIYKCALTAPTANALNITSNVNHVCAGTPVTLTASGGASVYNWSNSQTGNQITVNPSTTTTYQVNTTDVCGNLTSASIQIIVDNGPAPIINISATSNNNCPESPVTLTASGAVSYTWQPQNVINSTMVVNPTTAGAHSYLVHAQGSSGCVAEQSIIINVLPVTPVTIVASSTVACIDNPTPVILTGLGASTYEWIGPSFELPTNPITVQPTAPTNYQVNGIDANGCITSASITINAINCNGCSNCESVVPSIFTTTITTRPNKTCIVNDVTVYNSAALRFGEFSLAPGVRLIVTNGATLTINNAHLFACSDMWQGIEVQDGGKLVITQSLIEDAIVAVDVSNNSGTTANTFELSTSTFNKNYISIAVQNYRFTGAYPFKVVGCVFTCREIPPRTNFPSLPSVTTYSYYAYLAGVNAMPAPLNFPSLKSPDSSNPNLPYGSSNPSEAIYPNTGVLKAPFLGQKSFAGIYLVDVGLTTNATTLPTFSEFVIGIPALTIPSITNYFDNLQNGVIAKNSNLYCTNTVFQNSVGNGINGNGIYSYSDGNTFLARLKVKRTNGVTTNKFINCSKGILTENVYVHDVTGNEFRSSKPKKGGVTNAMWATTFVNWDFNVKNNVIYNYHNGITLSATVGNLSALGINTTSLYLKKVAINTNTFVPEMPGTNKPNNYVSNAVTVFNLYDPKYFIYPVDPLPKVISVESNSITAYRGISVQGFAKVNFHVDKNNVVLQKDHAPGANTEYGVLMAECYAADTANVYGNTIKGYASSGNNSSNHAILFKHSVGLTISCNTTLDTYNGLSFSTDNPQVGVYNNTMSNQKVGLLLDNNGTAGVQYQLSPGVFINSIGNPNMPADNQWLGGWGGSNKTYSSFSTAQSSPMYVQGGTGSLFNPNGSSASLPPSPLFEYSSNVGINTIRNASGATPVNCSTGVPPALVIISNPKDGFEKIVQNLNPITANTTSSRRVEKNVVYRHLKNDAALLASSSILQNFYTAESNTNNEVYYGIETNLAGKQIAQASGALAGVANQDAVDANHHVYDACLLHYTDTTQVFSVADSIALRSICVKCPYTQGFVVFRARALFNQVYHTIEAFADNCSGNANNRFANSENNENLDAQLKVELYPNPTSDKFSIVTETADAQLSIQILDVQGKVIFTDNVYVKNYETTVQANLANGVYVLNITNTTYGTKTVKKLVVQK